jgi:serine/threonine-protein kinase
LPFSEADRRLISAVGSAASLTLQNLRLRSLTPDPLAPAARECLRCCTLHPTDAAACPCGGQLQEALAPHVLRGVYRLECRIGSGGMGIVYQGRDLNLERLVAVKTLPRMAIGSAARLRREARAMAAVVHPNLAVIHGVETWRDIPFLVQEYLAGGTLAAKLATARLSIPDALDLGCTLAGALNALHQAGLVHRDIKPSNIGFTHSGVLKLLDFGLARQLEAVGCGSDDTTVSGAHGRRSRVAEITDHALVGTPPYMSPEALLNHPPQPSFDLWSLCVVLYESIACRRPFDGRDAIEMIELLASRRVVPPSRLIEGCPPAVDAFFERAFSMDAVHRPGSAQTLKVELAGLHRSVG